MIDNLTARTDINNNILDAHDGRIVQAGKRFYLYGTAYGNSNGYTYSNFFQSYSSEDFKIWKPEGRLFQNPPKGVYYRPHVIYNKKTKKYVLWYNWYPFLWEGKYGVATSDRPEGPFKIINTDVKVKHNKKGLGDLTLFVDDDGTAYIVYNTIAGHQVFVEKLSADYLSSVFQSSSMIAGDCEAATFFKRKGKYYLLTDTACCFCNYGTGANVYTAETPLGEYKYRNNINRYPGRMASSLIDGIKKGNVFDIIQRSGPAFESVQIDFSKNHISDSLVITLFKGNRPGNCGDTTIPWVHPDYIVPFFDIYTNSDTGWTKASLLRTSIDSFSVNVQLNLSFKETEMRGVRIVPHEDYNMDQIYISDIALFGNGIMLTSRDYGAKAYLIGSEKKSPVIPGQQTFILPVETARGTEYMWMADLWGSASDNTKGHDFQYWGLLQFDKNDNITQMEWVDRWEMEHTGK